MNKQIERAVRGRAGGRCEYCHLPEPLIQLKFSIDHVRAKQHGGTEDLANLALACGYCNSHKGPNIAGVDPLTGQMTRLFNPRSDHWAEHFGWQGARIVGLTPIGRATGAVLALNSPEQLRIRQSFIDEGVFPFA